ncbi:MAG: hypothetical protein J6W75_05340 [Bacteroidaceae bacterium]|nr:hypothetical protein [Bacteroidaceae bacterium]
MNTLRYTFTLTLLYLSAGLQLSKTFAQDTLWVRYDDRFRANGIISLKNVDSVGVHPTQLRLYNATLQTGYKNLATSSFVPTDGADMVFSNPGRYLLKPNTYGGTDYTNAAATSGYNFAHCLESDHYAVFWDVRYGENATKIQFPGDGNVTNANTVLNICEQCWEKYVELGFIVPGKSTTDKYKIQLYIPYQKDWRADASGTDGVSGGQTGIGHFNPWAANARGGHTVAHEVGHTFQYLVSADLGASHGYKWGFNGDGWGDCGWWESCADWQAYQIFPDRQFTDGEYFEQHLNAHHLNLLHEDWRYACCYIQDWWCMKHGRDFIGRLWREANKPEDPVETYKRMNNLTQEQFCDEMMEGYMRMATWDIDGVRDRAKHRIGQHKTFLEQVSGTKDTWQSDVDHCIQNYGYAIINMNVPKANSEVKAHFQGLAGADGWKKVNVNRAGWRYAFVAYTTTGERIYGDIQHDKEGVAKLTIPARCSRLFFVVMGAPTQHWQHPWDRNRSADSWSQNGEQWPFRVRFENTNLLGK